MANNIKNNRPTLRKDPQGFPIPEFAINNTKLVDYVGGTQAIYIGYAKPGSLTTEDSWQVCKLAYDVNNNIESLKWASGSNDFKFIWADRATYVYS